MKPFCNTTQATLKRIEAKLDALAVLITQGITRMSATDDIIAKLQSDIAALATENTVVIGLLNNLSAQLTAALAAASAAGATPGQLDLLTQLSQTIETQTASLNTAVTADTPTPPLATEPTPPTTP